LLWSLSPGVFGNERLGCRRGDSNPHPLIGD
jgi:hypothetical protein